MVDIMAKIKVDIVEKFDTGVVSIWIDNVYFFWGVRAC